MPVFHRTKRWMILLTGVLLSSILFAACGENVPSILDAQGPVADSERFVFWVILAIATVIFVGVEGALIYSIVRYRERPGMPNPRQLHGNMRVEIIWTVIPAIVLFIVLIYTIRGLYEVAAQPQGRTIEVTAVGHQWWWEFYYPQYNVTTADSLNVPVDTTIHVNLYSNNVIHSFWVPKLTGKTDLIPGHKNEKWFKANATGTYLGLCAEFCGLQHANMKFNVVVGTSDSFQTWVTTQQQAAVTPPAGSLAEQGAKVFASAGCTGCHGIVGANLKSSDIADPSVKCNDANAACLVGPNLTHFGSRNEIAGGVLENNVDQCQPGPDLLQRCNLAKWLKDPQGIKPGNDMVVSLSDEQVNQLVAYLESLK